MQGTAAQSPPATAIEMLSSGATGYDFPAVSADGRHVAFLTDARLDPADTNVSSDIYVRDRVLGTTALVSVTRDGVVGNGSSQRPSISADGRFVAFSSSASNLVPDDSNSVDDIFVLDRDSGEDGVFDEPDGTILSRVSLDTDGIEANCASARPSLSADGRYVAFDSCVTNWAVVFGKTLAVHDIFVHDRQRFTTEWVNPPIQNSPNGFNNHHSGDASISGDGRFVAFASQATTQPQNLGPLRVVADLTCATRAGAHLASVRRPRNGRVHRCTSSFSPQTRSSRASAPTAVLSLMKAGRPPWFLTTRTRRPTSSSSIGRRCASTASTSAAPVARP